MLVGVLDHPQAVSVNPLNRAVREDALFSAVRIEALDSSIREADLLGPIREMLLDLLVLELEDLKPVWESRLGSPCLRKEVDSAVVRIGLFDVLVGKPNYLVAVRPDFSLDAVRKHDLLFAV